MSSKNFKQTRYIGGRGKGAMPPPEAPVRTLLLQKSVESKAGKRDFEIQNARMHQSKFTILRAKNKKFLRRVIAWNSKFQKPWNTGFCV